MGAISHGQRLGQGLGVGMVERMGQRGAGAAAGGHPPHTGLWWLAFCVPEDAQTPTQQAQPPRARC